MKATILRGISGSGKSTFAKQYIGKNPDTFEINRDDTRRCLFDIPKDMNMWNVYKLNHKNEKEVTEIIEDVAKVFAANKLDIIDSDTNLNPKYLTKKIEFYKSLGYETEVVDIHCDLYEAIDRDAKRIDSVGANVIFKQYLKLKEGERNKNRLVIDPTKQNIITCDIDGTVARMVNRGPYEFDKVKHDEVREEIVCIVKALVEKYQAQLFFLSGREDVGWCYNDTCEWLLNEAEFEPNFTLWMREEGDNRKDTIVKTEFMQKLLSVKNVIAHIDDRPCVVDVMNDLGVNVICVADQRLRF